MSPRIVWVMVLACACGRIDFATVTGDGHVDTGSSGDDDGDDDGSASNGCVSPGYGDSFDETMPCQMFGSPMITNGMLNTSNGALTIIPNASQTTNNGCVRANAPYGKAGVFIEMTQVANGPGQTLMLVSTMSSTWGFEVNAIGTMLSYVDNSVGVVAQPYNPTAHRWLRVRPVDGATRAETSPDGKHWTTFATSLLVPVSPVNIAVYVQSDSTDTNPGMTVIEGIDVCP